jgi:hypothetical protein
MKKLILLSFLIVLTDDELRLQSLKSVEQLFLIALTLKLALTSTLKLTVTLTSLKSVEQFLLLLFLSRFSLPFVGRFDGIQILLEFALERKTDQNN